MTPKEAREAVTTLRYLGRVDLADWIEEVQNETNGKSINDDSAKNFVEFTLHHDFPPRIFHDFKLDAKIGVTKNEEIALCCRAPNCTMEIKFIGNDMLCFRVYSDDEIAREVKGAGRFDDAMSHVKSAWRAYCLRGAKNGFKEVEHCDENGNVVKNGDDVTKNDNGDAEAGADG